MSPNVLLVCLITLFHCQVVLSKADSVYCEELGKEAFAVAFRNPDSSRIISRSLLIYSQKHNYLTGISRALSIMYMSFDLQGNYDSARYYASKALEQAKKSKNAKLLAMGHHNLANTYMSSGQREEAFENYNQSLYFAKSAQDSLTMSKCYASMGILYSLWGRKTMAINQYQKALSIAEKFDDRTKVTLYLNISPLYREMGQYKRAIEQLQLAIKESQDNNDQFTAAMAYRELATSYMDSGNMLAAYQNYHKALNIFKDGNFSIEYVNTSFLLSNWYSVLLQQKTLQSQDTYSRLNLNKNSVIDSIIFYADTVKNFYSKSPDYYGQAELQNLLGSVQYNNKSYQKAIAEFKKGILLADQGNLDRPKFVALTGIYESFYQLGNLDSTLKYATLLVSLKDSIHNVEISSISERLKSSYELENQLFTKEKEAELASAELTKMQQEEKIQSRNYLILMIGFVVVVLLLIISILIYRQKKLKADREKKRLQIQHAELEQRVLRAQMNPHFISNSLTAIQTYVLKNKSTESASYLAKFSKLMRLIIESSRMELISLSEELNILNYYLDLQKLRFSGKLEYSIWVDEKLNLENTFLPPMLLQPFIENAIEHGISSEKGRVEISFTSEKDTLKVQIKDNGLGILSSNKKSDSHKSYATLITKERIENINQNKNAEVISFQINDLSSQSIEKNNGTVVIFTIAKELTAKVVV